MAILAAAGTFVLVLLGGAGTAIYLALAPSNDRAQGEPTSATVSVPSAGDQTRDGIAAAPMLQVSGADATAGTPSTVIGPTIQIPAPTTSGPARVAAGFPRTPEGAVGQLAAILGEVVQTMSIPRAHEVYQAWSEPGAAPAEQWSMTHHVATFLSSAGLPGQEAGTRARIEVAPAAAQIKGADGQDWVVACVLLDVHASIVQSVEVAYGHCEPMIWRGDRWVIASGPAPAAAPSTWSGTDLAAQAGWRTWQPSAP